MWLADEIARAAAAALAAEEARRTQEQSPYGLESLSEVELHPVIAAGLSGAAGLNAGVLREQPYPGQWRRVTGRRRKATALPDDSQRQRCDLVLTPRGGQRLADGLGEARAAEADALARRGTLFDSAPADAPAASGDDAVAPEDAYWLEIKLVGQFTYSCGIPGPNPAYASELVRGVGADLRKIRDDPAIIRGGAMLVLLTAGAEVARADTATLIHRLTDKGLLVRSPAVAGLSLPDRVGNRWCAVVLLEPMRL